MDLYNGLGTFGGIRLQYSTAATVIDRYDRNPRIPYSRHRSARVLKKLERRLGPAWSPVRVPGVLQMTHAGQVTMLVHPSLRQAVERGFPLREEAPRHAPPPPGRGDPWRSFDWSEPLTTEKLLKAMGILPSQRRGVINRDICS